MVAAIAGQVLEAQNQSDDYPSMGTFCRSSNRNHCVFMGTYSPIVLGTDGNTYPIRFPCRSLHYFLY